MKNNINRKAYLVGGGIASLAAAAFLIRDGQLPGNNVMIFEALTLPGGSLDGSGDPDNGYLIRGGRMLNFSYRCTYDLFDSIPSLKNDHVSVYDEISAFNHQFKTHSGARIVDKEGKIIDCHKMGFEEIERIELVGLMAIPEHELGRRTIADWFPLSFFHTSFWFLWASMFAFEPWHSLVEFRRYLLRFLHEFPRIDTLAGVDRTPYNQYDSMIRPLIKWLRSKGVLFVMNAEVFDLDLVAEGEKKRVERIRFYNEGEPECISVHAGDIVLVTPGSMTASSTIGSMHSAPPLANEKQDPAWSLWEKLAQKSPEFGHPDNFSTRIHESAWESFTVTCKDPFFFNWMESFSGNEAGTGGLVTFKDSSWLFSIVLAHQPHFIGQPKEVQVFWGYGLFPDRKGDYVQKPMRECTGAEILTELLYHLQLQEHLPLMLETSVCIPCMMPYITSQFLTREKGDRPDIVPKDSSNLGFIGQFTEIEDDVVFTVEYSVRSAQMAVYHLLGIDREIPAQYKGQKEMKVLYEAFKTLHR